MDRSTQKLTMDRSTQKLTAGRIHLFDVRPARNALKLVRGKFNNLIHNSMITLTQRTMHGRRVFISFFFDLTGRSRPEAVLNLEP
jgi:hypothetical protein